MRPLLASTLATFAGAILLLFVCSWASLEYTEFGLDYSVLTRTVGPRGYSAGRYFLGLGHHFVRFPATVKTIQFASTPDSDAGMLKSRTSDGLEVELEVSFQYLIMPDKLYDLYMKYGSDYRPVYIRMATDILTTGATKYTANQFFTERSVIGRDMNAMLEHVLKEQAFVTVPFFQLRTVLLPKEFEDAIQDTEVMKQDIQTAMAQQQARCVEYETKVIQAQQQVKVLETQGDAAAQSVLLANDAYVQQLNASVVRQAQAFRALQVGAFAGDPKALLRYMQIRAMREHTQGRTVVGLPAGIV